MGPTKGLTALVPGTEQFCLVTIGQLIFLGEHGAGGQVQFGMRCVCEEFSDQTYTGMSCWYLGSIDYFTPIWVFPN